MVPNVVETIFAFMFLILTALYFTNIYLYSRVINLLVLFLHPILGIFVALPSITWMFIRGITKSLLFVLMSMAIFTIYLITFPVQVFGKFNPKGMALGVLSVFIDKERPQKIRMNIIEVVAKNEGKKPSVYRSPQYYRNELSRIQTQTESRISQGEKTISLLFGFLLLLTSIVPIYIPQPIKTPVNIQLIAQSYLFIMGIIVVFRISFLEILMYNGEEEFDTPAHMDIAVTLQEATAQLSLIQFAQLLLSLAKMFSSNQVDIGLQVLDELKGEELSSSITEVGSRMKELQSEQRGREK